MKGEAAPGKATGVEASGRCSRNCAESVTLKLVDLGQASTRPGVPAGDAAVGSAELYLTPLIGRYGA
jgi:hypothetical protein